ncbi:MAG: hypothetical protein ACLFR1_16160 [Spirochaetia bacterium]
MKKLNYIFLLILASTFAFSGCGLLGLDTSPPAVQNVEATADETGSITVTWDALEEAQGYVPKVSEQDDPGASGWSSFIDRNVYPDGTTDTTATYTEGTPGTTYYFIVDYFAEGEDAYAEVDEENIVVASAEFPELNPGVGTIDFGFTDSLPDSSNNFSGTGNFVEFTLQGDESQIDHFTMTYSLEDQSADAYTWPSDGSTFTLDDVIAQDDGSYRIEDFSFPATYGADDGKFYTADGRSFGVSVKAYDASGNELESAFDAHTVEVFDEIRRVTAEWDETDTDKLHLYFSGSGEVARYRVELTGSPDTFEYGATQDNLYEGTQEDMGITLQFSIVNHVILDLSDMMDGSSSEHTVTVTPSQDGSTFPSAGAGTTDIWID